MVFWMGQRDVELTFCEYEPVVKVVIYKVIERLIHILANLLECLES